MSNSPYVVVPADEASREDCGVPDAEARYWATLDEPQATEADRFAAGEDLDRALAGAAEAEPEATI